MGGKTAQTSSQVQIPAEVLARYNSVNATAQNAAGQPFQQYSTDPNAFVAPINSQQQQGINTINQSSDTYRPYFDTATGAANDYTNTGLGYFNQASGTIDAAAQQGAAGTQAAYSPLQAGQQTANGLQGNAGNFYSSGYSQAQPFIQGATGLTTASLQNSQPYNAGATGLALAGAGAVNAQPIDSQIGRYITPYLNTVLGGTLAPVLQQQGYDRSAQQGQQIMSGAGFGDRAAISNAVLSGQQNLALGQIGAGILTPAYENALQTAQQQQGVNLSAGQANRAALQGASGQLAGIGQQVYGQGTGTAQQLAGLGQQAFGTASTTGQALQGLGQQYYGQGAGTSQQEAALAQQLYGQGAATSQQQAAIGQGVGGLGQSYAQLMASLGQGIQGAGLQGGQAQFGAGTAQQQTEQAGKSALYNQFQQQQGYPFQVAQFLANIAEGTGALSGSTTTSTSPAMSFLSDERAKDDIKPIGKTYDGQNIIRFRYKGDPRTQIGLSAQEVQHHTPEAVSEQGGLKAVNYDTATREAADRGHFYRGGLAANGGAVDPESAYSGFAMGGAPGFDFGSILAAQQGMYAPFAAGLGGGGYGAGIPNHPSTAKLDAPKAPEYKPVNLAKSAEDAGKLFTAGKDAYNKVKDWTAPGADSLEGADLSPGNTPDADFLSGAGSGGSGAVDGADGMWESAADFWRSGGGRVKKEGGGGLDAPPFPLADTYASYLAQQRMHPFTGEGLYGNPLISSGVSGAYGTMLEGPNSSFRLLTADAPKIIKYEDKDPSEASFKHLSKTAEAKKPKAGLVPHSGEDDDRMWRGGRAAFAVGGTSMAMPYNMGYVPEQEEPTRTLQVADPAKGSSGSSGSSGLGDLASLAKTAMMFAALKDGGRVGKDDGGPVGLFGEDIQHPRGLIPNGPADAFNRQHGRETGPMVRMDIAPEDVAPIAPEPSARVDIPPGTFSGATGSPRVLSPQVHSSEPATPWHIPPMPKPTPRPDQPEDVLSNVTPATVAAREPGLNVGNINSPAPSIPPPGLMSQAGDAISDTYHGLGLGGPKGSSPGATPTSGPDSDFMSRNQSWLVPLLKGVGAATLYPGKDLFGALAYGAQEGAESYSDIQNQMAERNLTGAETNVAQATGFNAMQQNAPKGWQQIPVPKGTPNSFIGSDGRSYVFKNKADFYGDSAPGIQSYNTTPRENAIDVDYKTGLPTIAPTSKTSQYLAKTFKGFTPGDDPVKNRQRILAFNPALDGKDKYDADVAKNMIGDPQTVDTAHRQLVQLANAINALPATGVTGRGSGFEGRQEWANLYQTARRMIGLGDDPTITDNLAAGDIIKKIQALSSTSLAHDAGQTSQGIADVLRSVLPGGSGQSKSSNEILATMMVQNQRQRDFGQYYNQYVGQYGISAGVNDAFNRDMGQNYVDEQNKISHLFAKPQGGQSIYEVLQQHPDQIMKVENGYTDKMGGYHPGLGVGISRYLK